MAELSAARVIYSDDHLVISDKPAGLLCVPGRGVDKQDCLSARVQQQFPDALVVHRLDMATSGLCVMARGSGAQRRLSMAFAAREVSKRYIAVVHGHLPAPRLDAGRDGWGTIDLPLIADWPNRPLSKVDLLNGKPSVTRWRVVPRDGDGQPSATTRLELEPVTGRSHQLRLHLQAVGHPILGDALYATPAIQALAPRLLLHASAITLPHPQSGDAVSFYSAPPF